MLALFSITPALVACGSTSAAGDDGTYGADVSVRQGTSQTSTPAADPSPSSSIARDGSTPPTKAGEAKRATTTSASKAPTTQAPSPVVTSPGADPIVSYTKGGPGQAAGVILAAEPAKQIFVEVMQEPNAPINQGALDRLTRNLREQSGKDVTVTTPVALPAGSGADKVWSTSELAKLADKSSRIPQGGSKVVLKYLYVRGGLDEGGALGVAFRGDLLAIFPDKTAAAGATQRSIEAIALHETGHLLGLVDGYLDRGRSDTKDDPTKHGHSSNKNSVMYWSVNPTVTGIILQNPSVTFDDEDLRDLRAIRAGAAYRSNPS